MKRLWRWSFRIFAALVLLVVLLLLAKDTLLKHYVQYRLRQETGGEVSIGRFEIRLLKPSVPQVGYYGIPTSGTSLCLGVPESHGN